MCFRFFLGGVLGLALLGAIRPAGAAAAGCTSTWIGPSQGSWAVAANWSTGKVPGEATVACIPAGKKVEVSEKATKVAVLQGEGTISLTGGSLILVGTQEASVIGSLEMMGGGMGGPGTIGISHTFLWTVGGSSLAGTGSTVLLPGAEGTISMFGGAQLYERHLINQGRLTFANGYLLVENGGEILNEGLFVFNSEVYPTIETPSASVSRFVNKGTVLKNAGTGGSTIEVPFENDGTVDAVTGSIGLLGGGTGSGGHWEAAEEAFVQFTEGAFSSTYSFTGGAWSGHVRIAGGAAVSAKEVNAEAAKVTVQSGGIGGLHVAEGSMTIGVLEIGQGGLFGPGTTKVSNSLIWNDFSGAVEPSGSLVILAGAVGVVSARGDIYGGRLVNRGSLIVAGEGRFTVENGGEILNEGTLTVNSEGRWPVIEDGGPGTERLVNQGTLQKTAGSGTTEVGVPVEDFGPIRYSSGRLEIQHQISVSSSAATPQRCLGGDPVNCATGNFTESQTDLAIGGRGVGLDLARTYSAQASVAGATGSFGHGWASSFGETLAAAEGGTKETFTDSSGTTTTFTRSGASYLAPGWSRDVLIGSPEAGFTLTLPDRAMEKFSGVGRLESVTDRNGNATKLTYGGSGRLEKITDPTGRSITLAYNAAGFVEKAIDPMGHVVRYAYESGDLTTVTLPGESGPNWRFGYDGSHRMTSITRGRGGQTTNEYDGSSRVVSQTDPTGRTMTWSYEPFHTNITAKATGAVTDEWFNSYHQPLSVTRGYGTSAATTETFTYTPAGLLASRTDGAGHTTTYGYDAEGNRTSERDAEGDESRWTFDGSHQLLTATTPRGETTTIERDAAGNPKKISRPAPESKTQTVSFVYGSHGEVESMTDPLGNKWTYGYDAYGNRIAEADPLGDKRTAAYDKDSRVTSTVSPRGNETGAEPAKFTISIERDAQERPIKVTDPLGGITKYAYDADGNVETVTDAKLHTTKFTYDAADELIKIERPDGSTQETGYDGAGQVVSQTDGRKSRTTYVRNVLEQPVEVIDPLGRKTVQTFDEAGDLRTKTDPEGRTTTYGYDKADRLDEISYSAEPGRHVTYAYDADGDPTKMVDATGESTFEYDQLGRLVHSGNGSGETVSWSYDLGDEPIGLTYPNGKSISRTYDKVGRLESVTDWLAHKTSFSYDRDSAPARTTFPTTTGDVDEYTYDRADRMSGVTMKKGSSVLASLAYTRDPLGRLESLTGKGLPGPEAESFGYDEDGRLTGAGSSTYGYDAADDLTKAPGTTNVFDAAGEIGSATGATFAYDAQGDRTRRTPSSGAATTYRYDQAGELTAVERPKAGETPAIAESLAYDGSGLLASNTTSGTTRHLAWDPTGGLPALLTDGRYGYLYGPDGTPFEQISTAGTPTYLHHDQLGSTRLLTGSSGAALGTTTYGAYGAPTGSTGTTTSPFGFAGQYTLAQSGLQYLRARFYDPATGQFTTRDPAVAETREPFSYAGGDPVDRVDPSGLDFTEELEGLGIPCIWCEAAHKVAELLEPSVDEFTGWGGWVLQNSLGQEELDEGESSDDSDESCAQPDLGGLSPKIERQMGSRGWTPEDVEEAFEDGEQVDAINKANGNPATRYINPKTGKSVVIDDKTGEIIHIGRKGFLYGLGSGDRP